jgi:tRNA (adenine22-N1)-methyltransferase
LIKLSKRLKAIGDFTLSKKSNKIIDVGCDHALLDIYLLQNNESLKIIASDNKEKPLENAKKNIEKYSFLNKIEVCLKDGINNIDKEVDTVIISGMGCETIIEILENDLKELDHINRLVLSSNNKYPQLREKVTSIGYKINEEKIIYEDKKYYIVIEFIKGNKKYSKKELFFGPILLKNKDENFIKYYNYLIKQKEKILDSINNDNEKKEEIIKEINYIKKELEF